MRKVLITLIAITSVASLSAYTGDWIGKGKGKAPPLVADPAPVYK